MGRYKYSIHVHTEYSPDSNTGLDKLYKVLKKNNISGVAITDHNTIKGALIFKKRYGQDIDVIIGEEIMTTDGEVIGLFLSEEIPKGLSPSETIKRIKEQEGVVYIPHPVDKKRYKTCLKTRYIEENVDDIDVIEIFNGRSVKTEFNEHAMQLCNRLNKLYIYGSDSHSSYELKFNQCIFKDRITRENFIFELNHVNIDNKKINKIIHQYTKYIKLKKLVKAGKFNEAFNFVYKGCRKSLYKVIGKN